MTVPSYPPLDPHRADPDVPSLSDLGWDERWQTAVAELGGHHAGPPRPARVVLQGRDAWRVADGVTERTAYLRGRLRRLGDLPVTGDWVLLDGTRAGDGAALVEQVLPRRTTLRRKVAGTRTQDQVLAANVDLVAVCTPGPAVNLRRLERELALVWESGAAPVVVVTKGDLLGADEMQGVLDDIRTVAVGADVVVVAAYQGVGVADVRGLVTTGRTLAMIGPSGAGKSTLGNALCGEDRLATHSVRGDGRGRHTTTSRELVPVPGGGLLLDTPGMREVGLWAADDGGLDAAFADVEGLATGCRFRDCSHGGEPGCAVDAAVSDGSLPAERLDSWHRLQRELAHLARRTDARLRAEDRRAVAQRTRAMRGTNRP